ncbi:MAG: M10 family metallopeptidase, partial [Rhodobacteraceae bacterium]|nr:M10 family metallopeptidase [Paracoccaceae bacterium]
MPADDPLLQDPNASPALAPQLALPQNLLPSASYTEVADAAATTSTAYTISVGDQFSGTISSGTDQDWVRINLTAGQTYVFTLWGTGGSSAGVDDTILRLYNSGGSLVTFNDNVDTANGNKFSQITYTASSSGTFYLSAGSTGEQGSYTLQAATNVYTLDQVVTQLTDFGWGIAAPIHHGVTTGGSMTVNITGLTAAGQQLARWALEAWSNATGITFSETASTAAKIMFYDDLNGDINAAYGGPNSYNPNTGVISSALVNVGTSWIASYGTTIGSYSFLTYLHEIGHALGLYHAGAYNGTGSFATDATFLNDSYQMTVMSYFDMIDNTFVAGSDYLPITPMLADIAAVADLYGTTVSAYSGDTTWGANSNVGGYLGTVFGYLFDGVAVNPSIYNGGMVGITVQDSGGLDTIDLSSETLGNRLDLNAEAVSDIHGLIGNMVIARGTVIENAIGGSGNDTITGNAVANDIRGGGGNDTL